MKFIILAISLFCVALSAKSGDFNIIHFPNNAGRDLRLLVLPNANLNHLLESEEVLIRFDYISRIDAERIKYKNITTRSNLTLGDLLVKIKEQYLDFYLINERSTVMIFSHDIVRRIELLGPSLNDLEIKLSAGDVVFIGNFGDLF